MTLRIINASVRANTTPPGTLFAHHPAMRHMVFAILLVGLVLGLPRAARADGYLAPGLGVAFGNASAQGRANFIVDLGWLSRREPVGVELDVTYAPSFFGNAGPYGENNVATFMGNVILAGGAQQRFGVPSGSSMRPYLSGGIGVIHETVTTPVAANKISNNDLGVNVGIGVMGTTRRNIGLRADVRYFRDIVDNTAGNTTNIDFGAFHFWRASIGVVFAF
jgi:opacity protein-like surface antigen